MVCRHEMLTSTRFVVRASQTSQAVELGDAEALRHTNPNQAMFMCLKASLIVPALFTQRTSLLPWTDRGTWPWQSATRPTAAPSILSAPGCPCRPQWVITGFTSINQRFLRSKWRWKNEPQHQEQHNTFITLTAHFNTSYRKIC